MTPAVASHPHRLRLEGDMQMYKTLEFECVRGKFELCVHPAPGLPPIDDYREVHLDIPGKGRYRAVLFLLPDTASDDSFAVLPIERWNVPAKWDDNTMLFVPSLDDRYVIDAFRFVLDENHEDSALEEI